MITAKYHQSDTQIRGDAELVAAAKADPRQFEGFYNKYYQQILEFTYARLDGKEEAYDVTSQVFLNALSNIHKYEHRGLPFSSWLYRIATNELNTHFRKTGRYRTVNIETTALPEILQTMDTSDRDEDKKRLIACMTKLSSADYLMIEMRFFEERSFKEIGEIIEITENNAKVRTYRAIDRLKRLF